jgi:hypothetical protein
VKTSLSKYFLTIEKLGNYLRNPRAHLLSAAKGYCKVLMSKFDKPEDVKKEALYLLDNDRFLCQDPAVSTHESFKSIF